MNTHVHLPLHAAASQRPPVALEHLFTPHSVLFLPFAEVQQRGDKKAGLLEKRPSRTGEGDQWIRAVATWMFTWLQNCVATLFRNHTSRHCGLIEAVSDGGKQLMSSLLGTQVRWARGICRRYSGEHDSAGFYSLKDRRRKLLPASGNLHELCTITSCHTFGQWTAGSSPSSSPAGSLPLLFLRVWQLFASGGGALQLLMALCLPGSAVSRMKEKAGSRLQRVDGQYLSTSRHASLSVNSAQLRGVLNWKTLGEVQVLSCRLSYELCRCWVDFSLHTVYLAYQSCFKNSNLVAPYMVTSNKYTCFLSSLKYCCQPNVSGSSIYQPMIAITCVNHSSQSICELGNAVHNMHLWCEGQEGRKPLCMATEIPRIAT